MSQTGLVAWSQTAASNGSADSAVNFSEGMAPSAVNNSGRGLMASVAKYRDDTAGSLTTGGTTTAYTLTTNQVFSSLTVLNGQELTVRFNQANGASPTLNVDSLGAKAIKIDATTAVPTGMIAADSIWRVTYDNSIPAFILNGVARSVSLSGAASVGGDLNVTGNVAVNTNKFTVTASSGNTAIAGTLGVTGDLAVNTDKATIAASSGNAAFAGTLAVTGATTLTGALTANNSAGITAYNNAKAYATFSLSGTTLTSSASKRFNVSGISRSATGKYDVTFATALPTANYIVVASFFLSSSSQMFVGHAASRTTTGFTFEARSTDGSLLEATECDFIVLGF